MSEANFLGFDDDSLGLHRDDDKKHRELMEATKSLKKDVANLKSHLEGRQEGERLDRKSADARHKQLSERVEAVEETLTSLDKKVDAIFGVLQSIQSSLEQPRVANAQTWPVATGEVNEAVNNDVEQNTNSDEPSTPARTDGGKLIGTVVYKNSQSYTVRFGTNLGICLIKKKWVMDDLEVEYEGPIELPSGFAPQRAIPMNAVVKYVNQKSLKIQWRGHIGAVYKNGILNLDDSIQPGETRELLVLPYYAKRAGFDIS